MGATALLILRVAVGAVLVLYAIRSVGLGSGGPDATADRLGEAGFPSGRKVAIAGGVLFLIAGVMYAIGFIPTVALTMAGMISVLAYLAFHHGCRFGGLRAGSAHTHRGDLLGRARRG